MYLQPQRIKRETPNRLPVIWGFHRYSLRKVLACYRPEFIPGLRDGPCESVVTGIQHHRQRITTSDQPQPNTRTQTIAAQTTDTQSTFTC